MIVAPFPIVALLILVQRRILAVVLVTAIPIGVIHDHFAIVPAMVVVMIVVVVADGSSAANAHSDSKPNRRKSQNSGAALQGTHKVNPPSLNPEVKKQNELLLRGPGRPITGTNQINRWMRSVEIKTSSA